MKPAQNRGARIRHRRAALLVGLLTVAVFTVAPHSADPAATADDRPPWEWPVAAPHSVLHAFEAPATPYSSGHRGIDIATAPGTPVLAPAGGTVYFSGRVVDRDVVTIEHEGGYLTSFEPVVTELVAGQPVTGGQQIGTVDEGGHCAAECLHFGVRLAGEYLSPLMMIGEVPRAVLLPLRP